jgi:hypothetical protein
MNNPDERTAVDQFGKGDKYFGICTLMVTMPGLPMVGHGQVEGFTEKYGMEYQRAYWDERPDEYLVQRHEREIFPLLHRRYLFAGVEHFLLYDFFTPEGQVNEDVFAYSNRVGDERALVVYHNRYASIRGWIRTSAAYSVKIGQGDERALVQKIVGEGLVLHADHTYFCIFRDHISGLEYIRNSGELFEKGLYVELGAYKCQVFLDFREVQDNEWHQYADLAAYLAGRGVPSIEEALKETFLRPIHYPFKELVNAGMFRKLLDARVMAPADLPGEADAETTEPAPKHDGRRDETGAEAPAPDERVDAALMDEVEQKMVHLLREIERFIASDGNEPAAQPAPEEDEAASAIAREVRSKLETVLQLPVLDSRFPSTARPAIQEVQARLTGDLWIWGSIFGWVFVHALGQIGAEADAAEQSRSWIDEWLLGRIIAGALQDIGVDEGSAARGVLVIKRITSHQRWFEAPDAEGTYKILESLLQDREVQQRLRVNRYQGILWFDKDAFERLLWWLLLVAVVTIAADPLRPADEASEAIAGCYDTVKRLQEAAGRSGYQVEKLLEIVQEPVA